MFDLNRQGLAVAYDVSGLVIFPGNCLAAAKPDGKIGNMIVKAWLTESSSISAEATIYKE